MKASTFALNCIKQSLLFFFAQNFFAFYRNSSEAGATLSGNNDGEADSSVEGSPSKLLDLDREPVLLLSLELSASSSSASE